MTGKQPDYGNSHGLLSVSVSPSVSLVDSGTDAFSLSPVAVENLPKIEFKTVTVKPIIARTYLTVSELNKLSSNDDLLYTALKKIYADIKQTVFAVHKQHNGGIKEAEQYVGTVLYTIKRPHESNALKVVDENLGIFELRMYSDAISNTELPILKWEE